MKDLFNYAGVHCRRVVANFAKVFLYQVESEILGYFFRVWDLEASFIEAG
jgi:hypothetical protein